MQKYLSRFMPRIRFLWGALSLASAVTLLLVACAGSSGVSSPASPTPSPTPVAVVNVKIVEKNGVYAFEPVTLSIKVGTQVVWVNDTPTTHTVTSDTGVFEIDNLAAKQTFKFLFSKPGTYPYYCNFHTYMTGTIIVKS